MLKTLCLLAYVIVSIGFVHAWDVAITAGDQIEFYTNQTKISNEGVRFRELTALAYDAVHNMLLFVDTQNDNASIFSYDINKKEYKPLVRRRSYENIQGLAFDPVTKKLFWTDTNEKSIYWKSLKPGSKNDTYGNLLIKMDDEVPRAIAVDSCRGYIYWTNINIIKPTIERARLDGSERTVILNSTNIYKVVSIAIDQKTKKLYWIDDKEGIHYSIESSDLDGKNQKKLLAGTNHMPNTITVSKDYLYWVDLGYRSVWKLPKNPSPNEEPEDIINFTNVPPFGIVANYKITEQIGGVAECEKLSSIAENKTVINDIFTIPSDVGLFCLHGVKVEGVTTCKCSTGYIGERCEISVCHNFCVQGDCSATNNGEPVCKCKSGYTGARCDVNICEGHCLNYGTCSIGTDQKPTCKCPVDFEGDRCEILKLVPTTTVPNEHCNCTKENDSALLSTSDSANNDVYVESYNSWDPVRDPIIMALGTMAGLLFVACAVLVMKVLRLRKRPRIKRRIIVNKNVTPLTARPDQCEITIENCCNMNICETPCFEPRNTIRPNLLNGKPGKEEKRNLIANMENDDPY
ncbi:PREDICTED: protein cueball [Papilio xuthus]|uniref:Protein cueball n=1 Tax=Papilio xuthus TaxID=66420 RepID=A0AAJ6ZH29_PAPXU|nr:PREDICTED: protein cueball [Papilio xuthus]